LKEKNPQYFGYKFCVIIPKKKLMETREKERVKELSYGEENSKAAEKVLRNLEKYHLLRSELIEVRLKRLEKEWDIERMLQLNAGVLSLTGTALGIIVNKKWLTLPVAVSVLLTQQAIKGWRLPVPVLRAFGFRTRQEIDKEKYALKTLRGDFDNITDVDTAWNAVND